MIKLRRPLSTKISIGITMLAAPIFVLALGVLFFYSRYIIREEANQQAESALRTAVHRVRNHMSLIQTAVNSSAWLIEEDFRREMQDSICRRIMLLNRNVDSCYVVLDPQEYSHPRHGFSVSMSSQGDTILTYCRPLRPVGGPVKGGLRATLSFRQLTAVILATECPYPHSYYLLSDKEIRHVDDCHVYSSPVPDTDWSLVLICPDNEVLAGYHQLIGLTAVLLIVGLLLISQLCHVLTRRTISPLNQLLLLTDKIAEGQYDVVIPRSSRQDVIGRLQNSFAVMQQSLFNHMNSIRQATEETKEHNIELAHAMALAEESAKKKEVFIQNVSHQMRTPLNIVMGFADVLGDSIVARQTGKSQGMLQEEEVENITETMTHNAIQLNRMVQMLFDSSEYGTSQELFFQKNDYVSCNNIAQECISYTRARFPKVTILFTTDLPDSARILTNHQFLMRTIRELLFNAAKYSDGQHINLRITETTSAVHFTVEDVGPGIHQDSQTLIFEPFVKVDDLSEGLGLGLPLARRHALCLGGDLIYDADYHDGCRFIVEVPK